MSTVADTHPLASHIIYVSTCRDEWPVQGPTLQFLRLLSKGIVAHPSDWTVRSKHVRAWVNGLMCTVNIRQYNEHDL